MALTSSDILLIIKAKDQASAVLDKIGSSGNAMGQALALGSKVGIGAIVGITAAVTAGAAAMTAFGVKATMAAGRVDELAIVNKVLGRNAGLAHDEVRAAVQAVRDKGIEAADKVVPTYAIDTVNDAANEQPESNAIPAGMMPAFSEEDPMKIEELQAQVAALTAERDALKATQLPADFAEREATLATREAAVADAEAKAARASVEGRVDAAIKEGRLLPNQRKQAVDFAMSLAAVEAVIDFGEGDKAEKLTQREAYLRQVEAAPKAVEYGERAPAGAGAPDDAAANPEAVAGKARDLVNAKAAEGKSISFTEAVAEVMATNAA
jgi:hypothetical protein